MCYRTTCTDDPEQIACNAPGLAARAVASRRAKILAAASLLLAVNLGGCAIAPPRVYERPIAALVPPPSTQVVVYPAASQSQQQQDRDRYECYRWAVQQSGFDPSSPEVAPHQRVDVVSGTPPGANTAVGAVTGAVMGAALSRPRAAGEGTILGAIAGALIGASSDASNAAQAERVQERYDQRSAQQSALLDQHATTFRRAISACLEARNYTVR